MQIQELLADLVLKSLWSLQIPEKTKDLAKKLGIQIGAPILVRKRVVYDPGNRPIEYNVGYYKSDSFVYTIESERDIWSDSQRKQHTLF